MTIPAPSHTPKVAEPYGGLYKYLNNRFADRVVLTFEQIESLLGSALPEPAHVRIDWWAGAVEGGAPSMQAMSWTEASMDATPNLAARSVTFERQIR